MELTKYFGQSESATAGSESDCEMPKQQFEVPAEVCTDCFLLSENRCRKARLFTTIDCPDKIKRQPTEVLSCTLSEVQDIVKITQLANAGNSHIRRDTPEEAELARNPKRGAQLRFLIEIYGEAITDEVVFNFLNTLQPFMFSSKQTMRDPRYPSAAYIFEYPFGKTFINIKVGIEVDRTFVISFHASSMKLTNFRYRKGFQFSQLMPGELNLALGRYRISIPTEYFSEGLCDGVKVDKFYELYYNAAGELLFQIFGEDLANIGFTQWMQQLPTNSLFLLLSHADEDLTEFGRQCMSGFMYKIANHDFNKKNNPLITVNEDTVLGETLSQYLENFNLLGGDN